MMTENSAVRHHPLSAQSLSDQARECARVSIAHLGNISCDSEASIEPPTPLSIGRGAHGEPLFPSPFKGSLAHTKGKDQIGVCAIVSTESNIASVGVDIELIQREITPRLICRITSKKEFAAYTNWCDDVSLPQYWRSGLAIFCAKEAAIKALSPLSNLSLTLRATEISYDPATNSFLSGSLSGYLYLHQGALIAYAIVAR
jgi:4'-phosphopantetheinyl transferase EntD